MINITDELKNDFLVYAAEVNTNRAFPDARDGLKVSQRACLWEMYEKGYFSNKPHIKSAKVVGGVIGSWHPHGDMSAYEAVVRMSQNWINNISEIDFHGANGSLFGGPDAASSRYTECRLAKASEDGFFTSMDKNAVDMIDNFSEDEKWPAVFPAIFPRLFVNGSQGIGYTIAQTWLPGNLNEFTEKVKSYLETGLVDYNNIYPDFPTGGIIINKDDIANIYKTGTGAITLRGKVFITDNLIKITELPYQVYAEPFIQKIKDLVNAGTLAGIDDICNKSDDSGLLIEVECSEQPSIVLNKLYKLTDLQVVFSANQMALVDGVPVMLNLLDYIKVYIEHNVNCIKREYQYELDKATQRLEIVSGLIKALSIIDQVIDTIKQSKSSEASKQDLITTFGFTINQAKAIVDMRLGRLANMEQTELIKEEAELNKIIKNCNKILVSKKLQENILLNRLTEFTGKYGYNRHTELQNIDLTSEKLVTKAVEKQPEEFIIALTKGNYIKRILVNNYKPQKKILSDADKIITTIKATTKERIILLSSTGLMYKVQVDKIALCANSDSAGTQINTLINDSIINIFRGDEELKTLFFITKLGLVKKMESEAVFGLSKLIGTPIMKMQENDSIIYCRLIDSEKIKVKVGNKEKIIDTDKFNLKGRFAGGVCGIKLKSEQALEII